ncbi:MAG: hypothetical protein ACTHMG_03295 [Sphingomonas sp.]
MKSLPLMTAAVALTLTLGACHKKQPQVIDTTSPDPMASQLANAAPVKLPPAMTASVTFRCKDNSLVYVDFFKGNTEAHLHLKKGDTPIILTADEDGDPLTGNGYKMTGDQDKITLTTPDKGTLDCHH